VIPVIERLHAEFAVPLSIDTSKPEVMRAAVAAGAGLINDVSALGAPGALEAAAGLGVAVCLMHMQGEPRTMQAAPQYDDVVADIISYLDRRVAACEAAGIGRDRLLLDPGFGFGKTLTHNLELLRRLGEFGRLDLPLLVGLSRKSMLGSVTGRPVEQRMPASVAAALMAVERGARVVRVHDVGPTVDAVRLWCAVRGLPA
jgi:dihydropteroate synthase